MSKKILKPLLGLMLAMGVFASCSLEDIFESFYVGDYDYEYLYESWGYGWGNPNLDFQDSILPPQGSYEIGGPNNNPLYNQARNEFTYNFDTSSDVVRLSQFTFATGNIVASNNSIIYTETLNDILNGRKSLKLSWNNLNDSNERYYVTIYSSNDDWETITEHLLGGWGESYASRSVVLYDKVDDRFTNKTEPASELFVAIFAAGGDSPLGLYETREAVRDFHNDQSILTDSSRRNSYFAEKGIDGIAIRFYHVIDNNTPFNWDLYCGCRP